MPVFRLTKALLFPPCHYAEPDGLLAVGGDLSPERLLLAYSQGIFPWYEEGSPPLWWSPDPRLVLFPDELRVSKSLSRVIRKNTFQVTMDQDFRAVISHCGSARRTRGEGTWIVPEMLEAYHLLHRMGFAHAVESRHGGDLVGGLYGVALGRVFFGESMFSLMSDASKVALVHLVTWLRQRGFELIDCQVSTGHLKRMGAREIPREEFLRRLSAAIGNGLQGSSWRT